MLVRHAQRMILLLALTTLTLGMLGCESSAQTRERWNTAIETERITLNMLDTTATDLITAIDQIRLQIAALPPGNTRDELVAGLGQMQEKLEEVVSKRDAVASAIDSAQAKLDSLPLDASPAQIHLTMAGETLGGAAPLLPGPLGGYAAIAGTILGGLGTMVQTWRQRRESRRAQGAETLARESADTAKELSAVAENLVLSWEAVRTDPEVTGVWESKISPVLSKAHASKTKEVVKHFKTKNLGVMPDRPL